MIRPTVAITQRVVQASEYPERRDALAQDWMVWLANELPGATAVCVPNALADPIRWIEALRADALILTGGNDWGDAPERDRTELSLFEWFTRRGSPILGVCRGLHVVNLALGGTLSTDLGALSSTNHAGQDHEVEILGDSFIGLSEAASIRVNSFHNQGVLCGNLASGLTAFALADDDVVEGVVHEKQPVMAIQWHPERPNPSSAFDHRLISRLLDDGAFWKSS